MIGMQRETVKFVPEVFSPVLFANTSIYPFLQQHLDGFQQAEFQQADNTADLTTLQIKV